MIEPLTASTKETLLQLMQEFYQTPAVLSPVSKSHFENTCAQILGGSPYAAAHLITAQGRTAGYGLLAFTFTNEAGGLVLWVEELYIRPAFRGMGLGGEYLAFLEKTYGRRVARMRLEVEPENEGARRLYARHGFEELPYMQMYKEMLLGEGESDRWKP